MNIIPPLQGLTLLETSYPRGFAPCYLLRPVGAEENYSAPSGLNIAGNVLLKGLRPLLVIPPRWG